MVSEIRYSAFPFQGALRPFQGASRGEMRYLNGETVTDLLYTGQRFEEALGIYNYGARWYDPALGRFIQADSIIPNPGNAAMYDRYSYVNNNPLRYTDPSGHYLTPEDSLFDGKSYDSGSRVTKKVITLSPLVRFKGTWTEAGKKAFETESKTIAKRYADTINAELLLSNQIGEIEDFEPVTPTEAFLTIHDGPITFIRQNFACSTGCAAETISKNEVWVFSNVSDDYLVRNHRVITHEVFHAFNNATGKAAQYIFEGEYSDLYRPMIDGSIQHGNIGNDYYGYAGGWETWQYGASGHQGSEEFSDSGIGWVYNSWGSEIGNPGSMAYRRMKLLNERMRVFMNIWY